MSAADPAAAVPAGTVPAPPPVPGAARSTKAALIAKGALRQLAQSQLEPTPEHYARAYADEAARHGMAVPAPAPSPAPMPKSTIGPPGEGGWPKLIDRLVRHLERGGRQWTTARRKESLQRLLSASRDDEERLRQRLMSLMAVWDADAPASAAAGAGGGGGEPAAGGRSLPPPGQEGDRAAGIGTAPDADWPDTAGVFDRTLRAALPPAPAAARALADRLAACAEGLRLHGAGEAERQALRQVCDEARAWFGQRHRLVDQLAALCLSLTDGMTELAEEDSWARGQCEVVRACLRGEDAAGAAAADADAGADDPIPSVRALRAAEAVLAQARSRHAQLRQERRASRDALRELLQGMLEEVGDLDAQTGRFESATAAHAEAIARADSLDGLADVVRAMLEDSRAVRTAVTRSRQRLDSGRQRADALEGRVRELESELRRLSEEASTDALTQLANRRGLLQLFEAEARRARAATPPATLAIALLDIDNFKRLNDSLGHAAGDTALKRLSQEVRTRLRPGDHLARFGGEEFVVLLPDIALDEAQRALTRLQRNLTEALFLHEGREVFVTFSAGVTAWRHEETLDAALERADAALYEAKRAGKNRTCAG